MSSSKTLLERVEILEDTRKQNIEKQYKRLKYKREDYMRYRDSADYMSNEWKEYQYKLSELQELMQHIKLAYRLGRTGNNEQ